MQVDLFTGVFTLVFGELSLNPFGGAWRPKKPGEG